MKKIIHSNLLAILVAVLGFTSACQKSSDLMPEGPNNSGLSDLHQTDQIRQTIDELCDAIQNNYAGGATLKKSTGESSTAIISACGTITLDTLSMPRVMTVDFGPTNCKASDGHFYRGKMITTWTGSYKDKGTVTTYTTENLYMDNNKIELNRVITNLGRNGVESVGSQLRFSVTEYSKITLMLGLGTITQQSEINRLWVEGENTEDTDDDVYLLSGARNLTINGVTFESETIEALRKENGYAFYISGKEKIARINKPSEDIIMDYGYPNNVRDNLALATFRDGKTEIVQMK